MLETIKTLVDAGGYAIIKEEKKIYFIKYSTYWLYSAIYVASLLLFLLAVNGIIQIIMNGIVGVIILIIAIIPFLILLGCLASWPGGSLILARGNLWTGGIHDFQQALMNLGLFSNEN